MINEKMTQKAVKLNEIIEYSSDSIVSKEIIDNKSGSITLFAFDKGQKISEHSAPFDAFVNVIDGEGEFSIAAKSHKVSAGECIIMPAGIPHAVRAVKRFKMILTMIYN